MSGYISAELRSQIREDAGERCGYCLSSEKLTGFPLEAEHILPETLGGETVRENLWLACHRCNKFKSNRIEAHDTETDKTVRLFNPRTQRWHEHFQWSLDATRIIGLSSEGRVTVKALQMNNVYVVAARHFWVIAGWHPPGD
ncbi:MAG: HNH endonuclease [Gammaproteobacteria bacterium]|nr:HNH endonuclease [Gammaproteobacteria bacterium]